MTAKDFFDAADRVDDLVDDLEDNIADGVARGTETVQDAAQLNLDNQDAVASGATKRGIRHLEGPPAAALTTFDTDDRFHTSGVLSSAPWSGYLERGTGVHGPYPAPSPLPPPSDIQEWIDDKDITSYTGLRSTPRLGESASELAWAIAQSIGERFGTIPGTPAQPYMLPAWHQNIDHIVVEARAGMSASVRRF